MMSGFDKSIRCRALKENGWVEVKDNLLIPPDSLWKNKPKSFYVYDALELHKLLGNPNNMTNDLKKYCGYEDDE